MQSTASLWQLAMALLLALASSSTWAREKPEATPAEAEKPKQPAPLSLTVEGDIDAAMAPIAGQLTTLFYECYPKLLARFEHPDKPAQRKIRLIFKNDINVPGYSHRDTVVVSTDWLKKHPQDIGLFTHELTHLVQAYPSPEPGWLTEGIADYARHLYGPEKQVGWSLPRKLRPEQSYRNSYGVTARFLVWLDEKHPGTVDKIHRKMQDKTFKMEDVEELTAKNIETLWRECVQDLDK
ncbi:basic secretory protein-like protein [Anatilimnocola sp. NA78]|uniref:basic secretory protein-like protein n=1 Tax=Anatilimnocola sp. NA78 TaxID=3415683 RepID=UPI003CE55D50